MGAKTSNATPLTNHFWIFPNFSWSDLGFPICHEKDANNIDVRQREDINLSGTHKSTVFDFWNIEFTIFSDFFYEK